MLTKPQPYLKAILRAQAIDLVVGAADADDLGSVDAGAENLGRFQIARGRRCRLWRPAGGVGGDAVGQVAGGGTADRGEAELAGLGQGHADDAVLEGERREVDGIVLEPELSRRPEPRRQVVGPDERSAADLRADRRFAVDGQQLPVAPHVPRSSAARISSAVAS